MVPQLQSLLSILPTGSQELAPFTIPLSSCFLLLHTHPPTCLKSALKKVCVTQVVEMFFFFLHQKNSPQYLYSTSKSKTFLALKTLGWGMILFALSYRSLLCPLAKVSSRVTSTNGCQSRGTDRAAAASPAIPMGTPPSNPSLPLC